MLDRVPDWLRNVYLSGLAAWALVGVIVLGYLVAQGLLFVRVAFPPILVALITIYLLAPLVRRLHANYVPRWLGVLGIYAAFIGVLTLVGLLLAPVIVREVEELIEAGPVYVAQLEQLALSVEAWLVSRGIEVDVPSLWEEFGGGTGALVDYLVRVTRLVTGALALLFALIMGLVIAFYVLLDLPRLQRSALRLLSDEARERVLPVLRDVSWAVGAFVRGQLVIAALVGLLSTIALIVLDIPNAVAIGLIAGLTNLVPFIGPVIGGVVAVVVAWVSRGVTPAIWVLGAFVIIQQIESQLISPNVMRRAVRIHPATAIIAIFVGAVVAGVWGMLLAIPAVAASKAALTRLWFPHLLADDSGQAEPPSSWLRKLVERRRARRLPAEGAEGATEGAE